MKRKEDACNEITKFFRGQSFFLGTLKIEAGFFTSSPKKLEVKLSFCYMRFSKFYFQSSFWLEIRAPTIAAIKMRRTPLWICLASFANKVGRLNLISQSSNCSFILLKLELKHYLRNVLSHSRVGRNSQRRKKLKVCSGKERI